MYDDLRFTLDLKGKSAELSVPCVNISYVKVGIHSYGFKGKVTFWLNEEEVPFLTDLPIINLTLTIKSQSAPDDLEPLKLEGVVTRRILLNESVSKNSLGLKVLTRVFQFEFEDKLQYAWSHYFPSWLATEKSMKDVLDEFVPEGVKFNVEAKSVQENRSLVAIGLGYEKNQASLYSFLMWLCERENLILDYDYKKGEYFLRDKKDESAPPIVLPEDDGQRTIFYPEPNRIKPRVYNHNHSMKNVEKTELLEEEGEELIPGATIDYLVSTPLEKEAKALSLLKKPKVKANLHRLDFDFVKYPPIEFAPGLLFNFSGGQWSSELTVKKHTYRLRSIYIKADAGNFEFKDGVDFPHQEYVGTLQATFELKEEETIYRPEYKTPFYPFPHGGIIFSKNGSEEDVNFDLEKDEDGLLFYTVDVRCLTNKQWHKVKAPYVMRDTNGEKRRPLLRGQVVDVHFDLYTAEIFQPTTPLDLITQSFDLQGNEGVYPPVLGDKSRTEWQHFDEGGHLVWHLHRREDPQNQKVILKKDGFHILVFGDKKESTPQCHIHMNNEHTITIVSENKDDDETQKMVLKPQQISLLCKKGGDESTIIQTPKSIKIKCKEFKLETDTTDFVSTKETKCKGKTVGIEGSSGIDIKDGVSVKMAGKTVDVEGKTTNIMGSTVNIG